MYQLYIVKGTKFNQRAKEAALVTRVDYFSFHGPSQLWQPYRKIIWTEAQSSFASRLHPSSTASKHAQLVFLFSFGSLSSSAQLSMHHPVVEGTAACSKSGCGCGTTEVDKVIRMMTGVKRQSSKVDWNNCKDYIPLGRLQMHIYSELMSFLPKHSYLSLTHSSKSPSSSELLLPGDWIHEGHMAPSSLSSKICN